MPRFLRLFDLSPIERSSDSAAAYVPLVMVSRALAFVRTLLVVRVLGDAGQEALGRYQPALEFVNLLVTLVLFGSADVVERYISHVETEMGHGAALWWAARRAMWVLLTGLGAGGCLMVGARWIGPAIWGQGNTWVLLALCAVTAIVLALYQLLASALRGMRAFRAAAGMEILSTLLMLVLSVSSAVAKSAPLLLAAYAASVAAVFGIYATLAWRHRQPAAALIRAKSTSAATSEPLTLAYATPPAVRGRTAFALWSLVRLLLFMLFGFLAIWGVRLLGDRWVPLDGYRENPGTLAAADFSVPYRVAQLLGFLALTLWSSTYGVVARAWSHGRVRRARVQYFRVGRLGLAALIVVTAGLVLSRGLIAMLLPTYAKGIHELMPSMAALFIWYAMAAFFSAYADLREQPYRGALLWGAAVAVQALAILHALPEYRIIWNWGGPETYMVTASAAGLAVALLIVGPMLLWRPFRWRGIGLPLAGMGMAAAALMIWPEIVDRVGVPIMLACLLLLAFTGQIIRPIDRRAMRRWWRKRNQAWRGNTRPT